MKVFLSWSGAHARHVALALKRWLPVWVPDAAPFMSEEDLEPGSRWIQDLLRQLDDSSIGIVVLTRRSLDSKFIHFEAGAIAKDTTSRSNVIPYLVGLKTSEVGPPFSLLQMKEANDVDTLSIVKFLNQKSEVKSSEDALRLRVDLTQYLAEVADAPDEPSDTPVQGSIRPESDVIDEILETVRRIDSRVESMNRNVVIDRAVTKEITAKLRGMEAALQYGDLSQVFDTRRTIGGFQITRMSGAQKARLDAIDESLMRALEPEPRARNKDDWEDPPPLDDSDIPF